MIWPTWSSKQNKNFRWRKSGDLTSASLNGAAKCNDAKGQFEINASVSLKDSLVQLNEVIGMQAKIWRPFLIYCRRSRAFTASGQDSSGCITGVWLSV
jgi:hypothetical protein